LPIGWYIFDVTAAVSRWLNGKYSKRPPITTNQLLIEKGEINVVRNNASIAQVHTQQEKYSFIPKGMFQIATLSIYSDVTKAVDYRSKRDAYSNKKRKTKSRRRNKRKGKKCRLHSHVLDFSEVSNYTPIGRYPG
jgi:hypothetical protein